MNCPVKVLYVSYDGMTDSLGQSQVIPYLAGLSQIGFEIHLLSCEKKERFEANGKKIQEILSKRNINWYPIHYTAKPPVISTIYDIYALKKTARKLFAEHDFRLVHCRSYIAAFVGLMLKRKKNIPFVFDMRGFWADERVDGNLWNLKNPIFKSVYKYFKKKESEFLSESDHVISLTKNAKNEIITHFNSPIESKNISVIPCCVDTDIFSCKNISEKDQATLRDKLKISVDDFVVSYSGSIGTWYLLDEMLDFYNVLLKTYKNARFLLITHDDSNIIRNKVSEKGIDANKIIITKASREQMPLLLSLSSVSLFFIKPAYSKKASSPTKMGELMSLGIPFISNKGIGDIDKLIAENKVGVLVDEFSEAAYEHAVLTLNDLLKTSKQDIVDTALRLYSLKNGVNVYRDVYTQLIGT